MLRLYSIYNIVAGKGNPCAAASASSTFRRTRSSPTPGSCLGLILTVAGLITRNAFLLAGAGTLLIIPLLGRLWNGLALFGVDYTRTLSETRAFLGETVELTLEVRNRKFLPVTWLHVTDNFPANLPVQGHEVRLNTVSNQGEFVSFWNPGVFGCLTRRFAVECNKRGYYTYGPATLSSGDGFGMFSAKGILPGQQRLIVYPKLYPAEELRLPAKNPFGERAADAHLVEDPLRYAGIRDWQPEDGMKRVHWKATARHQALLSRLYEPTQEPQVLIFLNVATLERHWLGHIPELMERAVSVAGSLAQVCAGARLPVGLIANGVLPGSDQPLRLLPGRSPDQLVRILELLAAVTPFASTPIEAPAAARIAPPALGRDPARGDGHRARRTACDLAGSASRRGAGWCCSPWPRNRRRACCGESRCTTCRTWWKM